MVDAFLVTTPNGNVDYPALSLPTLVGRLREDGYSATQRDLNIEIRDALMKADSFEAMASVVLPVFCQMNLGNPYVYGRFREIQDFLVEANERWSFHTLEETKRSLQGREYSSLLTQRDAFEAVQALFAYARALHNILDAITYYWNEFCELWPANPVSRIVESTLEDIQDEQPKLVGVSVWGIQRRFATWLIDRIRPIYDGAIAVGGADPTRYKQAFLTEYSSIDYAFVKEAEETLPRFLDELHGNRRGVHRIPGLVFRTARGVACNEPEPICPDRIATPDFTGLELDKYLLPALPIQSSRGCYFAKCKFCVHWRTYANYYERRAEAVVDDIARLHEAHGTRHFHFTDDCLDVPLGTQISRLIGARGLDIQFLTYARLEEGFLPDALEEWYEAGCSVIEWGLESGSRRVLDLMGKSIDPQVAERVLDASAKAGILNKVFMFHDYPGESVDDLRMSLDFLRRAVARKSVRPFFPIRNRLELLKGSTLFEEAIDGRTGLRKVWIPSGPFSNHAEYSANESQYRQKRQLIERFLAEMERYMADRGIYTTNDENVMLDLVTNGLKREGFSPALDNL